MLNLGSGLCAFIAHRHRQSFYRPVRRGRRDLDFCSLIFFQRILTQFLKLPESGAVHTGEKGGQQGGENKFQENG